MIESAGGHCSSPFPVETFSLFESEFAPDDAVYTIVERYPLDCAYECNDMVEALEIVPGDLSSA